jgi:hypothetical protein
VAPTDTGAVTPESAQSAVPNQLPAEPTTPPATPPADTTAPTAPQPTDTLTAGTGGGATAAP